MAGNPIGDVQPSRILAGHQRGPRRRANGARRVIGREPHAVAGQPVDVRRLVEIAAVAAEVGPTQIVGDDENDVRLRQSQPLRSRNE